MSENIAPPVAALFDLDGVLIDSETEYTKIWSEIGVHFKSGVPDLAHRIKGMTLDNILQTYWPDRSVHPEIREMLHHLENQMVYNWKSGARELLMWLRDHNIPRILVTSSDGKKMEHLHEERPDLFPLLDNIVTADMISHSKPNPEGYLLGASLANADPARCVVFEDSLQGVKAGNAAGCHVIGVAGTLPSAIIEPFCDLVVDNLTDLDPEEIFGRSI